MAEAFLYNWTDTRENKLYVGWHKGSIDDGYICSSKIMLEEYNKRPHDFIRQIIAFGASSDMVSLEATILKSINAKMSDDFYNMHNGHGNFYFKGHTEETKNKLRGPKTKEHRLNLSKNHANVSGENNPMFGTMGGFYNKRHSAETKEKMSKIALGKPKTKEHRLNLSKAKKGLPSNLKNYKYDIITCPHCNLSGGGGNMTRHHFDNCKEKKRGH